jgi:uncharacterized protein
MERSKQSQSQSQFSVLPENHKMQAIEPGMIRTFSGVMFNVFEPDPELICIEDITHALSNLCRFGGHTATFYSVAEHSIRCANLVTGRKRKLAALLHDASEAYLVDIPSPIKYFIPKYREIEEKLMLAIAEKLEFEYPLPTVVAQADKAMLEIEWHNLMTDNKWVNMPAQYARDNFLNYYYSLTK